MKVTLSDSGMAKLKRNRYASVREQKQRNTSIRSIDQRGRKLRMKLVFINHKGRELVAMVKFEEKAK